MKFLIDTGAAISLLPVGNVPIGVTVQPSDNVIEGISREKFNRNCLERFLM